jgi:hypothetical protein
MKIKLSINEVPYSGHINIDPCPKMTEDNQCEVVVGDPRLSVGVAENNECIEILAPNMLNYLHHTELRPFIEAWAKKIRKGGKFVLGGVDGYDIAKRYARQEITTDQYNQLIYGPEKTAWGYYLGNSTVAEITSILESIGFRVLSRNSESGSFIVTGVRN